MAPVLCQLPFISRVDINFRIVLFIIYILLLIKLVGIWIMLVLYSSLNWMTIQIHSFLHQEHVRCSFPIKWFGGFFFTRLNYWSVFLRLTKSSNHLFLKWPNNSVNDHWREWIIWSLKNKWLIQSTSGDQISQVSVI